MGNAVDLEGTVGLAEVRGALEVEIEMGMTGVSSKVIRLENQTTGEYTALSVADNAVLTLRPELLSNLAVSGAPKEVPRI